MRCSRQSGRDRAAGRVTRFCYLVARPFFWKVAMPAKPDPSRVGLPPRPFLYTVDQLATILSISERTLHREYVYHEGRDVGFKNAHQLSARNIAMPDKPPEWRVAELELKRWMKLKGFKFYDRGTFTS